HRLQLPLGGRRSQRARHRRRGEDRRRRGARGGGDRAAGRGAGGEVDRRGQGGGQPPGAGRPPRRGQPGSASTAGAVEPSLMVRALLIDLWRVSRELVSRPSDLEPRVRRAAGMVWASYLFRGARLGPRVSVMGPLEVDNRGVLELGERVFFLEG